MHHIFFARRVSAAIFIVVCAAALTTGVRAASRSHAAPAAPVIHPTGAGSHPTGGTVYTIDDVGGPSTATYRYSVPVAFNNAGELFGTGYRTKNGIQTTDCILYTGTKFVTVSPASTFNCTPNGMNNVSSAGVTSLIGTVSTPYASVPVAFIGTYTLTTAATTFTPFTANVSSALNGINALGEAIGAGYYQPVTGFFTSQSPLILPAGTTTLADLQPQCNTLQVDCASGSSYFAACPFGGCSINDSGTILSSDAYSNKPMTYVYGQTTSGTDLSINYYFGYFAINNAGQVDYIVQNSAGTLVNTAIYTIKGGTTTTVPALPGNSCTYYNPISMNNSGHVLGYTSNCSVSSDSVYWTWDPVNGTKNLNAEFSATAYASVMALGLNDNGQILVSLETTAGSYHWGLLIPPAAKTKASRGERAR